jgi:hypothetical protein
VTCRIYTEQPGGIRHDAYTEVMNALAGRPFAVVRITEQGEMIVSVAVPIQRYRAVLGACCLSTQGGDIDKIVRAERFAMIRVFAVAVIVNIILSVRSCRHHRQPAAPSVCRRRRVACAGLLRCARKSPISRIARTRSAIFR